MISAPNFYRNIGLAGGSLWLVAVGIMYIAWMLVTVQSALAMVLLLFLLIATGALVVFGARLMLSVRRLPHEPPDRSARRRLALRFGLIVAAEAVGCTLVAQASLRAHHWKLIVPLILIVVGLHFLPLARLFNVPRYYATGVLFCIISILTLLIVSPFAHIGHALSWVAIPTIGCGVVSLATAAAGLDEVRRFVNNARPMPLMGSPAHSV